MYMPSRRPFPSGGFSQRIIQQRSTAAIIAAHKARLAENSTSNKSIQMLRGEQQDQEGV